MGGVPGPRCVEGTRLVGDNDRSGPENKDVGNDKHERVCGSV